MKSMKSFLFSLLIVILLAGCGGQAAGSASGGADKQADAPRTLTYALKSNIGSKGMEFLGVDGDIENQSNPTLTAKVGDTVIITMSSGEGAEHDFTIDEFGVKSDPVSGQNKVTVQFVVDKPGTFSYYCSIPGHRQAGMEGKLVVTGEAMAQAESANNASGGMMTGGQQPMTVLPQATLPPARTDLSDIVRDPSDLPAPIGDREPTTVTVELETVEVNGLLADGTTYTYWTFNGQVPGPFLRVRVGDTVIVKFKNNISSMMPHSVDFHAVTGPGGGAVFTQMGPGQETQFQFKALNPGLFVYHCATPMVPQHIANGMYGMILVEPEGGLPPVDREFYVMQGEIYTTGKFGEKGHDDQSVDKLLNETPDYFVFNGAVGALTAQKPLKASVGQTVRIFFGVGGPNFTSSFHVIGEIFDKVYDQASLTAAPLTNVQTTIVPPGGATVVEFQLQVPGRYILVDHALSRLQRGLAGYLLVDGDPNPSIFDGTPSPGSGH